MGEGDGAPIRGGGYFKVWPIGGALIRGRGGEVGANSRIYGIRSLLVRMINKGVSPRETYCAQNSKKLRQSTGHLPPQRE